MENLKAFVEKVLEKSSSKLKSKALDEWILRDFFIVGNTSTIKKYNSDEFCVYENLKNGEKIYCTSSESLVFPKNRDSWDIQKIFEYLKAIQTAPLTIMPQEFRKFLIDNRFPLEQEFMISFTRNMSDPSKFYKYVKSPGNFAVKAIEKNKFFLRAFSYSHRKNFLEFDKEQYNKTLPKPICVFDWSQEEKIHELFSYSAK
jgi:hypothetical protein